MPKSQLKKKHQFKCEKCYKLCRSKQGLSRHHNLKTRKIQQEQERVSTNANPENCSNPVYFKGLYK